jgi:hypothetical protein
MRFKATNNGTYYIDLAKALSLQERRLHRQKAIYTVYGGFFVDSQGNRCNINTAPMTWVTKRSVNRGFAMWRKMTARTLTDAGATSKSKYRDFKVKLDVDMSNSPLVPVDANDQNLYSSGPEWEYSLLTTADPDAAGVSTADQFSLQIVGQHVPDGANPGQWHRIGLVQSWIDSRPSPEASQPNDIPDVTDPLMNLFDEGDVIDDRLVRINTEGDGPPYDELIAFGNASGTSGGENNLARQSVAVPATATPVAAVHGFQALCGLLQVKVGSDNGANQWELVLDVETKGEKF